ncbi:MAG: LL-diaminopimelate aminotransferase [Acutalibacteraceae bacterium]
MINYNKNFDDLQNNYLFAEVAKRVKNYKSSHPTANIISLGIGDVTLPLCPAVVKAMHEAVDDLGKSETFKGYGPYEGYESLRNSIREYYKSFGVDIDSDEIFVSDGAKGDTSNIQEIFSSKGKVLITNPTYPAYLDSSIIMGKQVDYLDANEGNNFLPMPDFSVDADIIYLCSPNNPTGAVYDKEKLEKWVEYALEKRAIILFDAAYESFVEDESLPRSIFEIDGSKNCAIEICSFSKFAGFTGVRCGYMVVPKDLKIGGRNAIELWKKRISIKENGVSYITQKGAEAALSEEGRTQLKFNIRYYKDNARILIDALKSMKIWFIGGKNSPYIWLKCPNNMKSWEFFDFLLDKTHIVGTPGSGFGTNGEGYFRLTSFGSRKNILEAVKRLKTLNLKGEN